MTQKKLPRISYFDNIRANHFTRRSFNKLLVIAGTTPLLTESVSGYSEQQPTYLTWSGWDSEEYFSEYIKRNGNPPNFLTFRSAEEALNRARQGLTMDVTHVYNTDLPRWIESDLLQPIDIEQLSNWKNIFPELHSLPGSVVGEKHYYVPAYWGHTGITIRTDLVETEENDISWDLLWNERYSGKIGMLASPFDTWWSAACYAGISFKSISSKANFETVSNLLRTQYPLVSFYTDDEEELNHGLETGQLAAAMTWNGSAISLQEKGIPVKFILPKEGAPIWIGGLVLYKDAPNPVRAHDLIDSIISFERGQLMVTESAYGTSNKQSLDSFSDEDLKHFGITKDINSILNSPYLMTPQSEKFNIDTIIAFEEIKAGY